VQKYKKTLKIEKENEHNAHSGKDGALNKKAGEIKKDGKTAGEKNSKKKLPEMFNSRRYR
jgi:hypothetical protein